MTPAPKVPLSEHIRFERQAKNARIENGKGEGWIKLAFASDANSEFHFRSRTAPTAALADTFGGEFSIIRDSLLSQDE